MNEDDPLTSYHKRTKRYLAAVASGANTLPFGCSDFYPSPTVLTGQYERDDDYVEDQEADLEELEVQDSRKKTPRPSKKHNTQEVSPDHPLDSSEEEEDSEDELEILKEDHVQPFLDHLNKRFKAGKLTIQNSKGAPGRQILDTLQAKHDQQTDSMAKGLSHYKAEAKKAKEHAVSLETDLQDEQKAHAETKQKLDTLTCLYQEALTKAKGTSMNSCPNPCFFLHFCSCNLPYFLQKNVGKPQELRKAN